MEGLRRNGKEAFTEYAFTEYEGASSCEGTCGGNMSHPGALGRCAGPLLLCVAVGVGLITVTSPRAVTGGIRTAAMGIVAPTDLPAPPKALVPERRPYNGIQPALANEQVALRQLVIGTDADDSGIETWRTILDRIGTPYDVIDATTQIFDETTLVQPGGVGKYSAVLLTNSALVYEKDEESEPVTSAFGAEEWNVLRDYERLFGVREVALVSSGEPNARSCLRTRAEEVVAPNAVQAELTYLGAEIFDYLAAGVRIPVPGTLLHRSTIARGCDARPVLTHGQDVLGAITTDTDGTQRMALTFAFVPDDRATSLLGYGLLRWATKGVFLGEQRHWLNVDIDDWFAATTRHRTDGTIDAFRMAGADVPEIDRQQTNLRSRHPLVGDFKLNLAYNGSLLDRRAPPQCDAHNTPDALSSYSLCLMDSFRWVNHTLNHPNMTATSYDDNLIEIADNLTVAASVGMSVPAAVLKTGEYSGLGVNRIRPDSEDVVEGGLASSNRDLLSAASDLGVKYMHGNMSWKSHQPPCFNCGIYHPLQPDILVVPDWTSDIEYVATTPEEEVLYYNNLYGSQLTYEQVIDVEAEDALEHLMSGSAYAHTLHQGNLRAYAPGKSLTFDWLDVTLAKYEKYYAVPLKNPDWGQLGRYVGARNSHHAGLAVADDPVWNRRTNAITYVPAGDTSVFVTGLETRPATEADQRGSDEAEMYGSDPVSRLDVTSDGAVTLVARPRA
jgi:hypothetical protein